MGLYYRFLNLQPLYNWPISKYNKTFSSLSHHPPRVRSHMLWPKQILRLVPMALHRSSSRTYPGYEIFSRGGCPYTTPRCRRPCTLPRVGGARGQGRPVLDAVQVQKDIPSLEALRRRHCRLGGEKPKISSTRPAPLACFQSMCRIGMWPRSSTQAHTMKVFVSACSNLSSRSMITLSPSASVMPSIVQSIMGSFLMMRRMCVLPLRLQREGDAVHLQRAAAHEKLLVRRQVEVDEEILGVVVGDAKVVRMI